ncbi:MAG: glucosyltransferase domain-containing protein [Lachnospiraceae bacterium]|nr:glucosyltransferase domain-containing protein [Lachnospiraceae bacterium]
MSVHNLFSTKYLDRMKANISFLISAAAAGLLMFFSVTDYWDFILFCLVMCVVSAFFDFNIEEIRKNMTPWKAVASLLILFFIGRIFFTTTVNSYKLQNLAAAAGFHIAPFALFATVLIALFAAYFVLSMICFLAPKTDGRALIYRVRERFLQYQNASRAFAAVLILYLLAISAILRADVDYLDDMRRIANGIPGWEDCSRYLSNFLSQILNTNSYLADISPLTQIIAVLLISAASVIVLCTFSQNGRISAWSVIAVLPLGISPYFLECLSYKFDSPYMALAVLAAVFPLLFIRENKRIYLLMVILCTLVSCMTYQASLGIFPMLILFLSFLRWMRREDGKEIGRLIGYSVSGYLTGGVIYSCFLMTSIESYAGSDLYPWNEMAAGIVSNLQKYYANVLSDFDLKWLLFIGVILISFIVLSVMHSDRQKWLTALLAIPTVFAALCMAFGPYIALDYALFQCRAMFGFGACIAMVAVIGVNFPRSGIAKAMSLCLSWCFFVFAFVYGNALAEQQRYVDFRTEMVISDLADYVDGDLEEPVALQIIGTIGDSPILENMPQYDGVLGRLIQTTFSGDSWVFDTYYFCYYYDLNNANGSNSFTIVTDLAGQELPVLYDGYYETIYGDETHILIELKEY